MTELSQQSDHSHKGRKTFDFYINFKKVKNGLPKIVSRKAEESKHKKRHLYSGHGTYKLT